MTNEQIMKSLSNVQGVFEVAELLYTFRFYRETGSEDGPQEVILKIFNYGPDANPLYKYYCVATTKDGKIATGNPDSSVELAIDNIHWIHLDR